MLYAFGKNAVHLIIISRQYLGQEEIKCQKEEKTFISVKMAVGKVGIVWAFARMENQDIIPSMATAIRMSNRLLSL